MVNIFGTKTLLLLYPGSRVRLKIAVQYPEGATVRSGPDPQNLEVKNNRESEMSDEKQIWIDTDVKKPPIEFPVQCRSNWCPLMGPGAMGI